ncbi:MAG: LD-carboxypeptidase [Myxococcaceae bacterium]|nr:LD-carboxypeptidase [Myxococcaceae bacterium]
MSFLPMPVLSPHGRLAVVAPSGPFERARFEQGLAVLAARYRVEVADESFSRHRYLAGDDATRGQALQRALNDESVGAIVAARGGYGAMRLLSGLSLERPVPVLGFSDVTALHLAWQARGWRSIHGPVVTQLGAQPADVVERTFALLEGRPVAPLQGTHTVRGGVATGPLIGGNLSLLASLVGSPFMPSLAGAVVLLEDIGERPYRLDRMWTHLVLSGALAGVAGVVLGEFTDCEEKDAAFSSAEVLRELTGALDVPVLEGLPVGHGAINQPVVLGARVRLDANAKRLEPLEGLA